VYTRMARTGKRPAPLETRYSEVLPWPRYANASKLTLVLLRHKNTVDETQESPQV